MRVRLFLTLIVLGLSTQASGQQSVAVPAFFRLYRPDGSVNPDWVRILQAGATAKIVVAGLDIGGNAGAGSDPCTQSPAQLFDCLRANGTLVLGYVDTRNATRRPPLPNPQNPPPDYPVTYVLHGGDGQDSVDAWYALYGGHIDGIFFDEGPVYPGVSDQQSFYQTLYQAMTTRPLYSGSCGLVGTGARACVMLNAASYAFSWVMTVTDYATLYEFAVRGASTTSCCCDASRGCSSCPGSPGCCGPSPQTYLDTRWFCPGIDQQTSFCAPPYQDPPGWYFATQTTPYVAHILFSATADDIAPIVSISRGSYGTPAFLYVHDQNCALYSRLPPFFEQLISAVRQ